MVANIYMENLLAKYNKNFNISKNIDLCDKRINLFAEYKGIGARTFITQKDVIDKFEFNEYCVVNAYDKINMEDVVEYTEYLKTLINTLVKPHREHKSSTFTGVIICNASIDKNTENFIKKFKFTKPYKLYFHGWSDIRLLLVDLSNNLVISNKQGNSVKKVYIPTSL
ncbi:hypothetical protein G9F72_007870 [Clostridium estertheticum]|uniref:hypothetical protein n=1 Tax=Clostridium estertheticum TaxID=238834 RepID=UPI0013E93B59|nr:hypothetical protein [Clostridium estertheticum]MBZ9686245.1 hypothetical protein [Clostridium estertheticum]